MIENGRRRSNRNIIFTPIANKSLTPNNEMVKQQPTAANKSTIFLPAIDTTKKNISTSKIIKTNNYTTNNNKYNNNTTKINIIADRQSSFIQTEVDSSDNNNNNQMKRVKFCKTEVHFTAETGRICIIETDTKPPAMKLQRRSRYRSQQQHSSGFQKLTTREFNEKVGISERSSLSASPPKVNRLPSVNTNNDIELMDNKNDTTDSGNNNNSPVDEDEVKGILKNRLAKPKSYLFGEHYNTENSAKFWGVQLKPISSARISDQLPEVNSIRQELPVKKSGRCYANF